MRSRWKLALCLLPLLSSKPTWACDPSTDAKYLHQVGTPQSALKNPVEVKFSLEDNFFVASFTVRTPTINAFDPLPSGEFPYDHDVVEVFLSTATTEQPFPYYEFELSPLGQTYQVKVPAPKKPFQEGVDLGMQGSAVKTADGWRGKIKVPLSKLGWDKNPASIRGNAFAIFGTSPARSFWSLSLPAEGKPKFHQPEFFRPLLNSCEDETDNQ